MYNTAPPNADPQAIDWYPGHKDVFWRGSNNNVYTTTGMGQEIGAGPNLVTPHRLRAVLL